MALRLEELSKTIDQTLLDRDATTEDVEVVCRRARELHVASVCVLPVHVPAAAEVLRSCDVKVCAVVGFPSGSAPGKKKTLEALRALADGAGELEFVMNLRALRVGDARLVRDELVAFVRSIRMTSANGGRGTVLLKAILGTTKLDDKLKKLACGIVERAELDFAQTSTGAGPAVARVADVELLRECLSESVVVKASGGIETLGDVEAMLNAGAGRIGSASASEILEPSAVLAQVS
jgi:deoxyribose-phosphate aldolase